MNAEEFNPFLGLIEDGRRFRALTHHSEDVLWLTRGLDRPLEYLSPAVERVWGVTAEQMLNDPTCWINSVHPDDLDAALLAFPIASSGEAKEVVYRIVRPNGEVRWIKDCGFPVRDRGGRIVQVGGIAQDVTDERVALIRLQEADERQELISREVHHRARNLMTMVQAAIMLTPATDVSTYKKTILERLQALVRANDLLEGAASQVSLREILTKEVAAYSSGGDRASFSGPHLALSSDAAEALTLAIHELVTNSVKYGALSVMEGRIDAVWEVIGDKLKLVWSELDGPPIMTPPTSRGFGSLLLRSSLERQLQGTAEFDWLPKGLRVTVTVPLTNLEVNPLVA